MKAVGVYLDRLTIASRDSRALATLIAILWLFLAPLTAAHVNAYILTGNIDWLYYLFTPEIGIGDVVASKQIGWRLPDLYWVACLSAGGYFVSRGNAMGPIFAGSSFFALLRSAFDTMTIRWRAATSAEFSFRDVQELALIQNMSILALLGFTILACLLCCISLLRAGNDIFVARIHPDKRLYVGMRHRLDAVLSTLRLQTPVPRATFAQSALYFCLSIGVLLLFVAFTYANVNMQEHRTTLAEFANRSIFSALPEGQQFLLVLLDGHHTVELALLLLVIHGAILFGTFLLPQIGIARACGVLMDRAKDVLKPKSFFDYSLVDQRYPIIFLRSFTDEGVRISSGSGLGVRGGFDLERGKTRLDRVLGEAFAEWGPVYAVGHPDKRNPPKPIPKDTHETIRAVIDAMRSIRMPAEWREGAQSYGACRIYLDDDEWKKWVSDNISKAAFCVVCIDANATPGVLWECEALRAQGALNKTLFLLHPDAIGSPNNRRVLQAIWQTIGVDFHLPADEAPVIGFWMVAEGADSFVGDYHFASRGNAHEAPSLVVLQGRKFDAEAYRITVRGFVRCKELEAGQLGTEI
ncbi:MAG: hypothetical protein KF779_09025 [Hyphomonadaceae bacterium]|nr:hypothetical protein [Hyphomonadaceae bacterium]